MRDASSDEHRALFWSEVGHDLRQPLYAAKLLAEALQAETDPAKRAAITDDLNASLAVMERMLDQTIDFGKLGAGGAQADLQVFAVADVVDDVAREVAVLAGERGLQLRLVASSCRVRSDPVLLRKILANLAGNAVRYTDTGRVLIGCRRRGGDLVIEVWDTGVGISEDQQDGIFVAFRQGASGKNDGLGLGLAIVRGTAEVLGHTVYVKSRAGAGSVFGVVVPRADV